MKRWKVSKPWRASGCYILKAAMFCKPPLPALKATLAIASRLAAIIWTRSVWSPLPG
jgi:hypothetical protein